MSRHLHGWRGALTGLTGLCVTIGAHVARELSHQGAKYGRKAIMRALNTTKADVFCLSGCRDEQVRALCREVAMRPCGLCDVLFVCSGHGALNVVSDLSGYIQVGWRGHRCHELRADCLVHTARRVGGYDSHAADETHARLVARVKQVHTNAAAHDGTGE